jgi:hypothetical protein
MPNQLFAGLIFVRRARPEEGRKILLSPEGTTELSPGRSPGQTDKTGPSPYGTVRFARIPQD